MLSIEEIVKTSDGINLNKNKDLNIKSYCIDSREVKKGDFFIPLVGNKTDAHEYILDCVKKGISGYFINANYIDKEKVIKESIKLNPNINIVEVADTKEALYNIAIFNRNKHIDIPVIAVTGSVGKTSTREMISKIFETEYKVLKTEKNYNSDIGISFMLLKLENQDICVLEAGISDFSQMEFLSKMLQPTVAVITNIGTAHIEFFKTKENILKEKLQIAAYIKNNGHLVINSDDELLNSVEPNERYEIIKYSISSVKKVLRSNDNICFTTSIYNEEKEIILNVLGDHNIYNSLCAIKVAQIFNIDSKNIVKGISEYSNFNRRFEVIKLPNNCSIIDDAYNASYDSMKAGLDTFNLLSYKNKIVVLGDMLELGETSEKMHRSVGKLFKDYKFSKLYLYGKEAKYIKEEALNYMKEKDVIYCNEKKDLAQYLKDEVKSDTAIYFKASNGMKFSEIIKEITNN